MKRVNVLYILASLICGSLYSQEELDLDHIAPYVSHFNITNNKLVIDKNDSVWSSIENAKFVGIAELHHSKQISIFTAALLKHLKPHGFTNFVMEIGPYSEDYLSEMKKKNQPFEAQIKNLNNSYGNRKNRVYPIPFVADKVDVGFLEVIKSQDYNIVGIDQEYIFSIPMHLDILNKQSDFKGIENLKEKVKKILLKGIKKKGYFSTCELLENKDLKLFFETFDDDSSIKYINDLKNSLSIYCEVQKGTGGFMERLDVLNKNFLKHFDSDSIKIEKSVFKFGSIHLAKEKNVYDIKDLGYTINKLANNNNFEFLVFRQLKRFVNGKDQIDTKTWKKHALFLEFAKKDKWTLIDLRKLKDKIEQNQILVKSNDNILFQIENHDFILIPPNDTKAKKNF